MAAPDEQIKARQKHQRACELCRRRKAYCDASERPKNICTRCTTYGVECEYDPSAKTRRPTRKYVEALETRLTKAENLLKKLHPNGSSLNDPDCDWDEALQLSSTSIFAPELPASSSPVRYTTAYPPPSIHTFRDPGDIVPSDDENEHGVGDAKGYHGKSSNSTLIRAIIGLKSNCLGSTPPDIFRRSAKFGQRGFELPDMVATVGNVIPPYTDFPPQDLFDKLVDAYFTNSNLYFPLLHRPTFQQDVDDCLHLRDRGFGAVVLLVCATGCAWVNDPRLYEPTRMPGWRWFDQVVSSPWSLVARPRLYDLQASALVCAYLNTTKSPHGSWIVLTSGIRMAQDVGAHRKRMYSATPTPEQELWKRAFWVLVAMDSIASFGVGRPCAIHDEDYDLDYMTECDDEYWVHPDPAQAFRQPPGKPSKIAFANALIRLLKIQAFASRTIYTINKSKLLMGFVGAEWKQRIAAEIDSALNKWIDTVPSHLRWDPDREDTTFLNQSAVLYTSFYRLQIDVHRQFIPSSRRTSPVSLPSLTICTSAARSCVNVLDVQWKRTGESISGLTTLSMPLFTACLMLLLTLWITKSSDRETQLIMEDVERCLNILKRSETSNHSARKLRAILSAMIPETPPSSNGGPSPSLAELVPRDIEELLVVAMEKFKFSLVHEPGRDSSSYDEFQTLRILESEPSEPTSSTTSARKLSPSPFCPPGSSPGADAELKSKADERAFHLFAGCDGWVLPASLAEDAPEAPPPLPMGVNRAPQGFPFFGNARDLGTGVGTTGGADDRSGLPASFGDALSRARDAATASAFPLSSQPHLWPVPEVTGEGLDAPWATDFSSWLTNDELQLDGMLCAWDDEQLLGCDE